MSETTCPDPAPVLSPVDRYLELARQQVGTVDVPGQPNKYQTWFGEARSKPGANDTSKWCAISQTWIAWHSDNAPAIGNRLFSLTTSELGWFRDRDRVVPMADAQPGDLVFFKFHTEPEATAECDHIGVVEENHVTDGYLVTLEGNTTPGDVGIQGDGHGFWRRTRTLAHVVAVGRPLWDAGAPLAPLPTIA